MAAREDADSSLQNLYVKKIHYVHLSIRFPLPHIFLSIPLIFAGQLSAVTCATVVHLLYYILKSLAYNMYSSTFCW